MGRVTRTRSTKDVAWIFLHPDPSKRRICVLNISGTDFESPSYKLFPTFVKEIKRKFGVQVNLHQMTFYTLSDSLKDSEFDDDPQLLDDRPKRARMESLSLSHIIGDVEQGVVHLLVSAPLKEARSDDVEELPSFTSYENVLLSGRSLIPSTAAKSKEYAGNQKKNETVIYDGFFTPTDDGTPSIVTIAPPVQIFHEVFQIFSEMIEDPEFHPDDSMVFNVSEMMLSAAAIHTAKDNKTRLLHDSLTEIFSVLSDVNIRTRDGAIFVQLSKCHFPLLMLEDKRSLGEGGCDPLTQASYSVLNQLADTTLDRIREKCCCPTFALAGGGPYLCVLGIVFTDNFIVQRLTDIMWLGEATTSEDKHLYRMAKVFTALDQCLEQLQRFYQTIDSVQPDVKLVPQDPHPRFFPCYTRFKVCDLKRQSPEPCYIDFNYIKALRSDADNVIFLVEDAADSSRKYVVKFVDRYCVDAHIHLVSQDLAPEVLYYGQLNGERDDRELEGDPEDHRGPSGLYLGPLRMVVMTYIEGNSASELLKSEWPSDAYTQVSDSLKNLHDAGFVFGDLRPPNVIFRDGDRKAFFIDFNWAGKSGRVRYPNRLSDSIKDVAKVKDFDVIRPEHDSAMLEHYFFH